MIRFYINIIIPNVNVVQWWVCRDGVRLIISSLVIESSWLYCQTQSSWARIPRMEYNVPSSEPTQLLLKMAVVNFWMSSWLKVGIAYSIQATSTVEVGAHFPSSENNRYLARLGLLMCAGHCSFFPLTETPVCL